MNFMAPQWAADARAMPNDNFVRLAQLSRDTDLPLMVLLFQEAPGLRYQLNFNGLFGIPWWSAFDAIQGITLPVGLPFDQADIIIPQGSELVYNGDSILVVQGSQHLGTIHRRSDVGVWDVWWDMAEQGHRIDQYDDRGFLSTRTWYDHNNQVVKKEWLDMAGQWVLRQTDHITVAPRDQDRFNQTEYPNITSVVGEYINRFLSSQSEKNTLVGLANDQSVTFTPFIPQNTIQHYFVTSLQDDALTKLVPTTASVIANTSILADQVHARLKEIPGGDRVSVRVIPPFSTTLQLGRSNEVAAVIAYWHVNGLADTKADVMFSDFLELLKQDEDKALIVDADSDAQSNHFQQTALVYAARESDVPLDSALFARIRAIVNGDEPPAQEPPHKAPEVTTAMEQAAVEEAKAVEKKEKEKKKKEDDLISSVQAFLDRITYQVRADYEQVVQDFATVRVLVDLGNEPDLFMQIAAISAGIPQINHVRTGYVTDHKNGLIIDQLSTLPEALTYYLDSLHHWNLALVVNAQLIDQYSEEHTQALWQEVFTNG